MNKKTMMALTLSMLLALTGCSAADIAGGSSHTTSETVSGTGSSAVGKDNTSKLSANAADLFSDRDMEIGYDEDSSVPITLSGNTASCDSKAVSIDGGKVTIKGEGTYILSGTLDNGMIVINAEDTAKIRLVLNGVTINNSTSAAIYIACADKVFITTAAGTENILSNGGEYIQTDDNNIDAVIFSKEDLTLNGEGSLKVTAAAGHGIVSKDDLVITGGEYEVTAEKHGIVGKDSVRISNGTISVKSGKDGIQSDNADDAEKGFIYISGGRFTIDADGDGISAEQYLTIEGGEFSLDTGEGSASVDMKTDAMGFGGGFRFPGQNTDTTAQAEETVSTKGIKTEGELIITGGSFVTDTEDDSFHSGGNITISGGVFTIKTGDDGVHSDADVIIKDGEFTITYCYEGIEGLNITVDGGKFDITAHDDGFNAAGGADRSGFGGGMPGMDRFGSSSDNSITINGGTIKVVSDGDCVDSNGALTITGGTLDLTCNGNGNTALDCDGTYTRTGGDVTTNDGSESNPGAMPGGGMGGHGGFGNWGGQGGQKFPDDMSLPENFDGSMPEFPGGGRGDHKFPDGTESLPEDFGGSMPEFPGGKGGSGGCDLPGGRNGAAGNFGGQSGSDGIVYSS